MEGVTLGTLKLDIRKLARVALLLVVTAAFAACSSGNVHARGKKLKKSSSQSITLTDRIVNLNGPITDSMIMKAQTKLYKLDEASHDPVWIRINSGGGSVQAGLILLDTMKALKSPTRCLVESKAYSMAAILLVFCDERYALDHATIMLHEASFGLQGEDPTNRSRMDFITKYLDGIHVEIAEILDMKVDAYRAKLRDAWWLLADEALKARIIDAIVHHIVYATGVTTTTETKTTRTYTESKQEVAPAKTKKAKKAKIPKRR
jgi:ATP-dependent Clp protease protease subunit